MVRSAKMFFQNHAAKRVMSLLLAAALVFSFTYYVNHARALNGDVNADGTVTVSDAMLVFNFLSGKGKLTAEQKKQADVDADGSVTIADAMRIFNIVSGKKVKGTFQITTYGWGHDIGMSQWGAHYYAKNDGWSYTKILNHYYPGAVITKDTNMPKTISYKGVAYSVRDYLAGTLRAEMGNYFSMEALKAQAIAQYTYAKYNGFRNMAGNDHAFIETTDATLYKAVDAVLGQYLAYNGKPILSVYFSTSAGKTAACDLVWYQKLDYLCGGVESKYDLGVSGYKVTKDISSADMKTKLESKYGVKLSDNPGDWLKIVSHDSAVNKSIGHVETIKIGGSKNVKGSEFYVSMGLRSPCYTIEFIPD